MENNDAVIKKNNLKVMIFVAMGVVSITVAIFIIISLFNNHEMMENEKISEEESSVNVDYGNDTADVSKEQRTIDYYWNINTKDFDKTKFNGDILVFGNTFNKKLTGKTLQDGGFKFVEYPSFDGDNMLEDSVLVYDSEEGNYKKNVQLLKNDKLYKSAIELYNYKGIDKAYDDSTELYYDTSTDAAFLTYEDVIVPSVGVLNYSEITIDDVIDSLGVPTYVENRTTKLEDALIKSGVVIRFDYVYVYDDYLFEFSFSYNEYIGIKFNNNTYSGVQRLLSPFAVYDIVKNEEINYESYLKFLENEQKMYLDAIKG